MVVVLGRKFACATCIKGHRSSSCNHTERPLFAIRAKGRPVSQCEHCRELRKTKQVHVKCECDTKPLASAIPDTEGQPVVARKGARKVKTLENQKPVFPNGISSMEEAEQYLTQLEANEFNSHDPGCSCKDGGSCSCCTDRYVPKHARGDSSSAGPSSSRPTHGSRPSISLTIPHPDDGPSSPSHATTPTHGRRGSRSHSRSPSRTNMHPASEGHVIGGSPNDHHRQHALHYSPYPTSAINGPFNQSPASAAAASMSPSLLAPPGMDNPFAYNPDSSAPTSPLSVDFDRPGSAISVHSGRNTPFDYSNLPGTPTHPQTGSSLFGSSDLTAVDAMGGMSLAAGNTSPHSATVPSGATMDQILSSAMSQRLSPFSGYRQSQQEMPSPISPTTPQFLSPTESSAQTSPTSYAPLAQAFNPNMPSVDPFGVPPTSPLEMQQLMSANFGGPNQQYADVFDSGDMEQNDGVLLFGDRSRRGSHQSIASSHSGHGGYLQPNHSSPFHPGSAPISAAASPNMGVISDLGELSNGMALLGQSDGTSNPNCSSSTKGCTCLNLDGSLKPPGERCALVDCPCCARRDYQAISIGSLFGGNGSTSNRGFALSTERDTGSLEGVGAGNVGSSFGMGYPQSLQIPLQVGRSRSSSQSSQISNISTTSFSSLTNGMSGIDISVGTSGGASGLGRANSTGQIGRGSKYKNIAPKPMHHNTEPVTSRAGQLQPAQNGTAGLASSQQPFSVQRASGGALAQSSPALIVTQPQPSDGSALDQLIRSTLEGSSGSLFGGGTNNSNAAFGNGGLTQAQSFNPKPMFEFSNTGAISTPDTRHMRNLSHPTNLQTMVTSVSGPPSPHPRSPVHFGDASGSGSGPSSPLLHHPSSPSPNSPLLTQPSSPSIHQTPPIITISHGRSQSSSNVGLLEPRPMHFSQHTSGHGRSASTSFLNPLGRSSSFPSVIVTPASPHPGSLSGQQQ